MTNKDEKEAQLIVIGAYIVSLAVVTLDKFSFLPLIVVFFLAPNLWIKITGTQYDVAFYALVSLFVDMYILRFGAKRGWSLSKRYSLIGAFHVVLFILNISIYIAFGEAI